MISLLINGKKHEVDVEGSMPLLWAIRDVIGYTGTKFGCGVGICGACSILVDGQITRSCVTPISDTAGKTLPPLKASQKMVSYIQFNRLG